MSTRRPYNLGQHPLTNEKPMTPEEARLRGLIADPTKLRHAEAAAKSWASAHNINTETGRLAEGREFARDQVMRGDLLETPIIPQRVEDLPEATDDPPKGSLRWRLLHPEEDDRK